MMVPRVVRSALLCGVLAGLLALPGASLGRADCASPHEALMLLTPAGARIPVGSGLLASVGSSFSAGRTAPSPQLVSGQSTFPLRRVVVGPGLVRLDPVGVGPGRYSVQGLVGSPAVDIEIAASPLPPLLEAPRPRAAVHRELAFDYHAGNRTEVQLDLGAPVPPGAVAIVARWGSGPAGGSSAAVQAGDRVVVPYRSVEGCDRAPADVSAPRVGQRATFAFVDALGRVGPFSTAVSIAAAP